MSSYALTSDRLASVLGDRTRVLAALEVAFAASAKSPYLVLCAQRIAKLLGTRLVISGDGPEQGAAGDACLAFAEQWVIDVASMTPELVGNVGSHLGEDGLMDFVHSLLVIEQRIRLELAWRQLGLLPAAAAAGDSLEALEAWGRAGPAPAVETAAGQVGVAVAPGAPRISPGRHGSSALSGALSEWQAAVVCLHEVDALTTELVRLRCASYHDCHT